MIAGSVRGSKLPLLLLTLAAGAAGGAAFAWLGTPLPWMLGALFVTVVLAIAGVPLHLPGWLRRLMIAVLGVMLGSAFTPDVVDHLVRWGTTLIGMVVFIVVAAGIAMWLFRRFGGFDPVTAFFAASPGGLSEMVVLGPMMGGNARQITLVHATRIVLVIMIIPPLYRMFTEYVPPADLGSGGGIADFSLHDLAVLTGAGVVGLVLAKLLRIPSYQMIGPLLASAAIHVWGLTSARPPFEFIAVAQVVIGCGAGVRFAGITLREMVQPVGLSAISTIGLLALAACFAAALAAWTGLEFKAILLAYGPGGFAEMNLIALSLGIEVAFVATHHVARVFLVVLFAAWLSRWLWGRRQAAS